MRLRITVAASVLAAAASFPLAGVALALDEDCPIAKSQTLDDIVCEQLGADGKSQDGSVDGAGGAKGAHGGDGGDGHGGSAPGAKGADGADAKSSGGSAHGVDGADGAKGADGGNDDSGPAPAGGVETGAGGTAGDDAELLLPLSVAGGAALVAGGVVLVRRRPVGQAG